MSRSKNKRWKVPTPIKLGIAAIGAFFILIALIGSLVHGQNMTAGFNATAAAPATQGNSATLQQAKGCIGNDQTTGKTYIDLRCLQDLQLNQIMCDNWPGPGNNSTCPNTTVPHNIGVNVTL